jgi:hypothetical protein
LQQKALASKAEQAEAFSREEKSFDLRHSSHIDLGAEELSKLQKFVIVGCYGPGFILFGGVDEVLVCLPD